MTSWPILSLLNTVFGSILEVFLLCVVGYLLARHGILDKRTQKQVNRLNVSVFTPSLLFSKVAFFLTPAKLKELWIIPIVFVVTTAVSMIVAYIFATLFRLKRSQRSFAMAASMFMNSNSLPVAVMQSLVYTVDALRWGDDDQRNSMLGRALTYLVLYSTFGMMLRWSYGVHLLRCADEVHATSPSSEGLVLEATETTPLLDASKTTVILPNRRNRIPHPSFPNRARAGHAVLDGGRVAPIHSFPNTPPDPRSESSSESDRTFDDDDDELPQDATRHPPRHRVWRLSSTFLHKVNDFMTAPMWAGLASLIVACIQPLQHVLDQHARPIRAALTSAGNCSIPLTLVVLGAYFYTPRQEDEKHTDAVGNNKNGRSARILRSHISEQSLERGVRKMFDLRVREQRQPSEASSDYQGVGVVDDRAGETKTVFVAVMSRMVLTPLVLLPLLTILIASDAQQVFDDPVFVVSNVLLITSAPALTLAQITQKASGDAFERLISRTIFWAYCVVTPPSTIISVVIGLLLAKL